MQDEMSSMDNMDKQKRGMSPWMMILFIVLGLLFGAVVTFVFMRSGNQGLTEQNTLLSEKLMDTEDQLETERSSRLEAGDTVTADTTEESAESSSPSQSASAPASAAAETIQVLPQVYIHNRLDYSAADLNELQTQIVDPVVAYYDSQGYTVVSIDIDDDNPGSANKSEFTVNAIISNNDGDDEPVTAGFIHEKVGGAIPLWEPIEVPEGYQG